MASIEDIKQTEDRVDIGIPRGPRVVTSGPSTTASADERVEIDLTQVAPPPAPNTAGVEIRESLTKDLLEGPNSPFGKYVAEKTAEYHERMAIEDQKRELEEDLADSDEDPLMFDATTPRRAAQTDELGEENTIIAGGSDYQKPQLVAQDMSGLAIDTDDITQEYKAETTVSGQVDTDESEIEEVPDYEVENFKPEAFPVDTAEDEEDNMDEPKNEATKPVDATLPTDVLTEDPVEDVPVTEAKNDVNTPESENQVVDTPESDGRKKEEVKDTSVTLDETFQEDNYNDTATSYSVEADAEDLADMEVQESAEEVDPQAILKHLQQLATERLQPVSKKLNISGFTINKKATANINVLTTQAKTTKWVLPAQGACCLMKEFTGDELEALREFSEDSTSAYSLMRKFNMIYEHIASPKPATYEEWAKSTPYADIDHYFFNVYLASFKGANFLPADCENNACKEAFLTEDIPVFRMVKFDDQKSKDKFDALYHSENFTNGRGLYTSEVVPLSEHIAVGFRDPSIYNIIEIASLDQKFRTKYASVIDIIPFIDAVYMIDLNNQTLTPIGYKVFPDNAVKTTKMKVSVWAKALKTLSPDEFGVIKAYMRAVRENVATGISYQYPETECPKCKQKVTAKPATAEELVFTRYQLGALVNTSLK